MIKLLYFASLRERLDLAEERLNLPPAVGTVGAPPDPLRARGWRPAAGLGAGGAAGTAVNQELASPQTPVADGDEVAIFPPVTGG